MSVQISITESALVDDLITFFETLVDCDVVRGLPDQIPDPLRDCVVITPIAAQGLSLPTAVYADPATATGTLSITQATQWSARVDSYGTRAHDRALALSIALCSPFGCEFLGTLGRAQPLSVSAMTQWPIAGAEGQFFERWSFDASLQFNPFITVPQQFADQLHVGLIEVDTTYPTGA